MRKERDSCAAVLIEGGFSGSVLSVRLPSFYVMIHFLSSFFPVV